MEKAEKFIALVDVKKNGVIDFDEFCRFIVLIKQGDERLTYFPPLYSNVHVIDSMHACP